MTSYFPFQVQWARYALSACSILTISKTAFQKERKNIIERYQVSLFETKWSAYSICLVGVLHQIPHFKSPPHPAPINKHRRLFYMQL